MTQLIYSCANCTLLYRVSPKNEPLFVRSKYFLSDYKFKIIKILYTVIQAYYLYFHVISKKLIASYVSIANLKMMFQKI